MYVGNLYIPLRIEWAAFIRGAREFRSSVTTSYDHDGTDLGYDLQLAYDCGREFAHWATFRRFEG